MSFIQEGAEKVSTENLAIPKRKKSRSQVKKAKKAQRLMKKQAKMVANDNFVAPEVQVEEAPPKKKPKPKLTVVSVVPFNEYERANYAVANFATSSSSNLLPNSTFNFAGEGWLHSFNANRLIKKPLYDKPKSHVLHFPLGRVSASMNSQPSSAILIQAKRAYTISFDFKQDGIFVPNTKILAVRLFSKSTVGADAKNAKWDYYLLNDGLRKKGRKPLGITELGRWYRVTFTVKSPVKRWLRILPMTSDAQGILATSYREFMVTKGKVDAAWTPHESDGILHIDDGILQDDALLESKIQAEDQDFDDRPVKIELSYITKQYSLLDKQAVRFKDFLLFKEKKNKPTFWALKGISLKIKAGESLGLVGVNGSGKSTLSNIIAGLVQPTTGCVKVDGEVSIVSVASGLKNELTGIENIRLKLLMSGFKEFQIDAMIEDIVLFSELGSQINQLFKYYSSGMKARLGFAIMVHMNPDIMIVDEGLAVGDSAFKKKCEDKITEFKALGKTFVIVSHGSGDIKRLCEKTAWIEAGELLHFGDTADVLAIYHNYVKWFEFLSDDFRNQIADQKRDERIHFNLDQYYELQCFRVETEEEKETLDLAFSGVVTEKMSGVTKYVIVFLIAFMVVVIIWQIMQVISYWASFNELNQ